ncbi:MAG: 3-deoxy-D-manno-octulosonic acid transferase [Porticoccaceae bacterium]
MAASTHEGEEGLIAESFRRLWEQNPELRLVLVPRHPERCPTVAEILEDKNLLYRLRSGETALDDRTPVLLCDKLGELRAIYGLGKLAFIGGTLVDHGGHNPLEAAAWGAALVAGLSQRNFDEMFNLLGQSSAMRRVKSEVQDMVFVLSGLLENPDQMDLAGNAALAYLQENRGACEANLSLFRKHIGAHIL